jgi:hypothetical protein
MNIKNGEVMRAQRSFGVRGMFMGCSKEETKVKTTAPQINLIMPFFGARKQPSLLFNLHTENIISLFQTQLAVYPNCLSDLEKGS